MKLFGFALVGALLIFGQAAMAQTTQCFKNGDSINCTTAPPPNFQTYTPPLNTPQPQAIPWAALMQLRARREAEWQRAREEREAEEREAEARRIGQYINAGACDQAKREALALGDLNLAQQVVSLCVPKPGATVPPPEPKF